MDIQDKTVLITGGTSGVGKAIALGLAKLGANIVILSRSRERGQETLKEIAEATGNKQGEYLVADLSLQSSIREASEEFKRRFDRLHVLVNAGGAVYFDKQLTAEGIERTFALNDLGHFIQRVNPFSGLGATAQALFARVIFTYELARRLEGTGVKAFAFYPGLIKSNLTRNAPWYIRAYGKLSNRLAKEDCEIGVYLAAAKEVGNAKGVFFDDKRIMMDFPNLQNEETGRRLWSISEELSDGSKV